MSGAPLPPFLPENLGAFTDHVTAHTPDWFKYCRAAYEYIGRSEAVLNDIREKALESDLRVQALEKEISHLKHEHERQLDRLQGARDHQQEQLQRMTMKLVEALKERDQAISLATPIVLLYRERLRLLLPQLPILSDTATQCTCGRKLPKIRRPDTLSVNCWRSNIWIGQSCEAQERHKARMMAVICRYTRRATIRSGLDSKSWRPKLQKLGVPRSKISWRLPTTVSRLSRELPLEKGGSGSLCTAFHYSVQSWHICSHSTFREGAGGFRHLRDRAKANRGICIFGTSKEVIRAAKLALDPAPKSLA